MDNLKKYLQQHLDELDADMPGDAVGQRLRANITPLLVLPKRTMVTLVWQYAAAACVLAFVTGGIFFLSRAKKGDESIARISEEVIHKTIKELPAQLPIANTAKTIAVVPVRSIDTASFVTQKSLAKKGLLRKKSGPPADPSLLLIRDVERNYAQLVTLQRNRLRETPVYAESPGYFSSFKQQLKQIEEDGIIIKKEIRLHGLSDELLQQLININQQKLNVLKDLQTEIGKLNNKAPKPGDRSGSTTSYYLNM